MPRVRPGGGLPLALGDELIRLRDVQRVLGILPRASYIAAAFNPEAPPQLRRRPPEVATPPSMLRQKFGDKRFAPLDPGLLDVEGLELVLIGTPGAAEDETGIEPWH